MKSFSDEIASTIETLKQDVQKENSRILDPNFHKQRITKALQDAVAQVVTEDEPQAIIQQLLSIINQVPAYVAGGITEGLTNISQYRSELNAWVSVRSKYEAHCLMLEEESKATATTAREDEIFRKVAAGEVKEREVGERPRSVGDHPGPTVREIRAAKAKLKQSSS